MKMFETNVADDASFVKPGKFRHCKFKHKSQAKRRFKHAYHSYRLGLSCWGTVRFILSKYMQVESDAIQSLAIDIHGFDITSDLENKFGIDLIEAVHAVSKNWKNHSRSADTSPLLDLDRRYVRYRIACLKK